MSMTLDERILFFQKVLSYMGLKPSYNRMLWLMAQSQVENTAAQNNPLATTWDMTKENPSWEKFNGSNVKNYATTDIGALATAKTLLQARYYPTILDSLKKDKNPLDPSLNQTALAQEYFTYGRGSKYWQSLKIIAATQSLEDFVKKKWKPITAGLVVIGISLWVLLKPLKGN